MQKADLVDLGPNFSDPHPTGALPDRVYPQNKHTMVLHGGRVRPLDDAEVLLQKQVPYFCLQDNRTFSSIHTSVHDLLYSFRSVS